MSLYGERHVDRPIYMSKRELSKLWNSGITVVVI